MSTAPWDQPRNATTVTRTQAELDAMVAADPSIEIHTQNPAYSRAGDPERFCCLISWANPGYSAQLTIAIPA